MKLNSSYGDFTFDKWVKIYEKEDFRFFSCAIMSKSFDGKTDMFTGVKCVEEFDSGIGFTIWADYLMASVHQLKIGIKTALNWKQTNTKKPEWVS